MRLIKNDSKKSVNIADERSWLASIIETCEDAILSVSPEGKILTFNRAAESMFGYSGDEILGESIFKLVPLGYGGGLQEKIKRIREGEILEHFDTLRMKKDGTRFHVSVRISLIKDSEGRVAGMSWVLRDITRQKQAEEKVTLLASVVEQTDDMVMICDRSGEIEYVNPAFVSLTGYSKAEALGKHSRLLKSGQHPPEFYKELWDTVLSGRPFRATMINRKKTEITFLVKKPLLQ